MSHIALNISESRQTRPRSKFHYHEESRLRIYTYIRRRVDAPADESGIFPLERVARESLYKYASSAAVMLCVDRRGDNATGPTIHAYSSVRQLSTKTLRSGPRRYTSYFSKLYSANFPRSELRNFIQREILYVLRGYVYHALLTEILAGIYLRRSEKSIHLRR